MSAADPGLGLTEVALNDGTTIPQLGFGVYQVTSDDAVDAVTTALETGYRHIDTAAAYGNEVEVGQAVRALPERVYVTTKYFNPSEDHGYHDARSAFDRSLDRLALDHVDLYLVHFPVHAGEGYAASWTAVAEMRGSDRLHSAGVSNFTSDHLARAIGESGVVPAVNQVELHPYFQQADLRQDHRERGIATEAWGPLGRGGALLEDPLLVEIAQAHGRTVAQVVLRWHLQLGNVVIPKSVTPDRIRANYAVGDFTLTEDQMAAVESLDRPDGRIGPDPATFEFAPDAPGGGR